VVAVALPISQTAQEVLHTQVVAVELLVLMVVAEVPQMLLVIQAAAEAV
tara:strand:- start:44 stop:190 length:147 start_codon:yes stop_codon:yes gene_type:complete